MSEQDRGLAEETPRVVVRDRRRVDPDGTVRAPGNGAAQPPAAEPGPPEGGQSEQVSALQAALDERTADLQRVKAEFDNYRRRVERDRAAVAEQAVGAVVAHLLPVLDDIDRARGHGELTGGFKSVAESVEGALGKLGLERFGDVGDPFDPVVHEAVTHQHSPDVSAATCVGVLRAGYRLGERLLRPAMVAVAEPPETDAETIGSAGAEPVDTDDAG